jgi:hypothetical protein
MKGKTTTESIVDEIKQTGAHLLVQVSPPIEQLCWTRCLPDFQEAADSAKDAMIQLFAATQALQAGHNSDSPVIDRFLFEIRSRMISITDDSQTHGIISPALKIGRTEIFKEIADAQNAARKRGTVKFGPFDVSQTGLSDFNWFRGTLAMCWVKYGFWLTRDEVIASVITTVGMKPLGCNRQTINRAVGELDLYRRKTPPIVGIGKGGRFEFSEEFTRENRA